MKPRVMMLVVFTSITGLLNATNTIHPFIGFVAILCVIMGAGSAATFNMWYDRDIDGLMERTKRRPIIIGNINPEEALSFSIVIGFLSVFLMALAVNFLAAILLATSILYYDIIYTIWLKRSSIQNVVIGGVSGALPPLIGTACVDNVYYFRRIIIIINYILMDSSTFFCISIIYKIEDYTRANIPMMPIIKGKTYTKVLILTYTVLMVIVSLLPVTLKLGSYYYLAISFLLGGIFFYHTLSLFTPKELVASKKLFVYSIYYLFILFLVLCINPIIHKYLGLNFK